MKVKVQKIDGKASGDIELNDAVFGVHYIQHRSGFAEDIRVGSGAVPCGAVFRRPHRWVCLARLCVVLAAIADRDEAGTTRSSWAAPVSSVIPLASSSSPR